MTQKIFILLLLFVSVISCQKKKVIHVIPTVIIEEDISIAEEDTIWDICFPNKDLGFAGVESNYIYRTENGGASWQKIFFEDPGVFAVNKIHFLNDSIGICAANGLYRTEDSGLTWQKVENPASYYNGFSTDILGITDDGKVICGSCDYTGCTVYTSLDSAKNFFEVFPTEFQCLYCGEDIVSSKVSGNGFVITNKWSSSKDIHYYELGNNRPYEKGYHHTGKSLLKFK